MLPVLKAYQAAAFRFDPADLNLAEHPALPANPQNRQKTIRYNPYLIPPATGLNCTFDEARQEEMVAYGLDGLEKNSCSDSCTCSFHCFEQKDSKMPVDVGMPNIELRDCIQSPLPSFDSDLSKLAVVAQQNIWSPSSVQLEPTTKESEEQIQPVFQ